MPLSKGLIDAGVAVYSRGFARLHHRFVRGQELAEASPLRALAAVTGGVAYTDRDDLDVIIRRALEDGRVSYTLGFYQSGDEATSALHQIGVRVNRAGVTLRYRNTYSIHPPQPISASPVADLIQALNGPADETAIGIGATATRTGDRLHLSAAFDLGALDLQQTGGSWQGKVEVVARFTTARGVQVGGTMAETMKLKLSPAVYESMLKGGLAYHKREWAIPPKAVEFKLLIGNLATGKIGTMTIPLSEVEER